jgi:serine/threonine-protein kinase RsbW
MTAAALPCEWNITIHAETSNLAKVRDFVDQVAADAGLDAERTFDLKVAVSEACANAVEHSGTESRPLGVSAHLGPRRLTFVITDNGLFRPPSYSREDFGSRGLGLPLMVTLMDEVSFAKSPEGGTQVTLSVIIDRE